MNAAVRHPKVKVQLTGRDGNCFAILGTCLAAARRAGVPRAEIDAFLAEAMAGDYDHLLRVCMTWFDVS